MNYSIALIPALKETCLVLKWILRNHGLNETYTGGLSSLGLFILLISCYYMNGSTNMSQVQLL